MACITEPLRKKRKPISEPPVFGEGANDYYGKPIPLSGGTRKIAGRIAWAAPFRVVKQSDGTKRRFASFIVLLGYPLAPQDELADVGILRLWINQTLVLDRRGGTAANPSDSAPTSLQGKFTYRFYNGSEDQLPDSVLERDKTMAKTERPAYRGMIYLVIEDLDLGFYGWDVIPSDIQAEIADSLESVSTLARFNYITSSKSPEPSKSTGPVFVDWENNRVYQVGSNDTNSAIGTLHCFDLLTGKEYYCINLELPTTELAKPFGIYYNSNTYDASTVNKFIVYPREKVMVGHFAYPQNSSPVGLWHIETGKCIGTYGERSSSLTIRWDNPGNSFGSKLYGAQVRYIDRGAGLCPVIQTSFAIITNGSYIHIQSVNEKQGYWIGAGQYAPQYYEQVKHKFVSLQQCDASINHLCLLKHENDVSYTKLIEPPRLDRFTNPHRYSSIPFVVSKGRYLDLFIMDARSVYYDLLRRISAEDGTPLNIEHEHHENIYDFGEGKVCFYMVRDKDGELVCFVRDDTGPETFDKPLHIIKLKFTGTSWELAYLEKPKEPVTVEVDYDVIAPELYGTTERNVTETYGPIHDLSERQFMIRLNDGYHVINLANGQFMRKMPLTPVRYPNDGPGVTRSISAPDNNTSGLYNSRNQSIIADWVNGSDPLTGEMFVGRSDGATVSLTTILRWMALKAGYTTEQLYIEELGVNVYGAVIDKRPSFIEMLEQLRETFGFAYYESENKLKIVNIPRDQEEVTPDVTLTRDGDLAPIDGEDGTRDLVVTRASSSSLPSALELTFIDPENDYTSSTIRVKRLVYPVQTSDNNANVRQLSIPIVMKSRTAYDYLNRMLAAQWNSRVAYETRIPPEYMRLEPADIVKIVYVGAEYVVFLHEATINGDYSLSINGLALEMTGQIDLPEDYQAGIKRPNVPRVMTRARVIPIDTAFLSSTEADAYYRGETQLPLLVGIQSTSGQFESAEIFAGNENETLPSVGIASFENPVGYLLEVPTLDGSVFDPQRNASLSFNLASGSITAAEYTDTEWVSGRNAIIFGNAERWEIAYFKKVEVDGEGVVTLTGLIRGRRGTEVFVNEHIIGDIVVVLQDTQGIYRVDNTEADVNSRKAIGAVGEGMEAYLANTEFYTYTGEALRCFAPHFIRIDSGTVGVDDLLIKWERRDKVAGQVLVDGLPVYTSPENSEEYTITRIPDDEMIAPTVITGIMAREWTYTLAALTADGGAVTIQVQQVNEVGSGHAGTIRIEG